ncbi:hypoxanthine phosphoribosyltransferase [Heliobacillus mobilis]|uniref:Hypoxanthine phosphoribosyltransferase n=2 Tax=Heliobacterium TaxID=2697 RepID=A0A6I3SJK5_HELMO|nr:MULTISPECIES: hypoxanthine phosphoribosyltransferase [Heliobacterium]MBC9784769.1 hypoxanthine phosphoribosyltransferase [Heliobacterium chlorum]MTV49091.1 hypoxanthine phosphoribosyltransferase [Heliobacterium mobile]
MEQVVERILVSEADLKAKVKELGESISTDYAGKDLLVVGILKGALVFMADLIRSIRIPIQIDFMAVSSYGQGTRSSGAVRILKDLDRAIEEKHILIVEDIVDTGLTLNYLLDNLKSRGAASVKVCTILDKPSRRKIPITPDYNGFVIPDEFVIGYGLDYAEDYRHLPYVAVLKPEVYSK